MTIETKQHMFQVRQYCEQCVLFMNIDSQYVWVPVRFIPKQFENNEANRIGHAVQTEDLKINNNNNKSGSKGMTQQQRNKSPRITTRATHSDICNKLSRFLKQPLIILERNTEQAASIQFKQHQQQHNEKCS